MAAPASDPSAKATTAVAAVPSDPSSPHQGAAAAARAEDLVTELSNDLMSPYCPGRTIASCPSPQARKLEAHILEQAKGGKTRPEIEAELVARFPDIRGYVGRPEILYGTALVALIAILGLVFAARRWVGRSRLATAGGLAAPAGVLAAPAGDVAAVGGPARAVPAAATAGLAGSSALSAGTAGAAKDPSRREIDALDDALDRIDEF